MSLGNRIKEARKNKNLTQEELGKLIGAVKSSVNGYENDKTLPDAKKMYSIMQVLGVSADYLFQDEFEGNPTNDILSLEEKEIIDMYRFIDDFGKTAIKSGLELEVNRMKETKEISEQPITKDDIIKLKDTLEDEENVELIRKIIIEEMQKVTAFK